MILTDTKILNVTLRIPKAFTFEHERWTRRNTIYYYCTSMAGFNGIEQVVTLNMKIEKLHKDRLYNYVYDKF